MGVRGRILEWIDSYLFDRKMVIKYESSETGSFNIGLPWGSVLRPLLLLLYVNDLPLNITEGYTTTYADDKTVIADVSTLEKLQNQMKCISTYVEN